MRFEERVEIPVSIEDAWEFLWQVERLASCLPGCRHPKEVEPKKRYQVQIEDHIGPFRVHFDLDVVVQEAKEREFIRVLVTGQDKRLGATQNVMLNVRLSEVERRKTALDVTADVELLGKIATLGQFAIKRKIKDVVKGFTQNIQAALEPGSAEVGRA
jgi:uncharacterized protein